MRNPNLTQSFLTAERIIRSYSFADDAEYAGLVNGLTDYTMDVYGLHTETRGLVLDTVKGKIPVARAVKAIKAVTALYEDES